MIRHIKNRLEGRRKIVDESMTDWRYRVSHGFGGDWKLKFEALRDDPKKLISEIWKVRAPDIPASLLRHYEGRIMGGVNIRAGYNLLDILSFGQPIGNYDESRHRFDGRKLRHQTVDDTIKVINEAKDSGYVCLLETRYPVQRHQIFEGDENERHYLDLKYDFVKETINAVGNHMYYLCMPSKYITIDFLVKK